MHFLTSTPGHLREPLASIARRRATPLAAVLRQPPAGLSAIHDAIAADVAEAERFTAGMAPRVARIVAAAVAVRA